MTTLHIRDTGRGDDHAGGDRRARMVLDAAQDEMDGIVLDGARRIQGVTGHMTRELVLLKQQVDVSLPDSTSGSAHSAAARPSAATVDALIEARADLDRLIAQLRPEGRTAKRSSRRLGRRSMVMITAVILTWATVWILAARWMIGQPESPASEAARTGSGETPATDVKALLRQSSEQWLLQYLDGAALTTAGSHPPSVHDERHTSERVAGAARRVVAPARVDVFGDAAVLSTSVTEYPPQANTGVVSLVSQLWTRTAGAWRLDEVRIVGARSAESAFRR